MSTTNSAVKHHKDEEELEQAIDSFQLKWKYAVFPAMIAFVILSVFGFYLIFGMLQRMESLSQDVNRMADTISDALPAMQQNVGIMASDMHEMNEVIGTNFPKLEKRVDAMSNSTEYMAQTTSSMGHSIEEMNDSVSKPLSMMNRMIPWSRRKAPVTNQNQPYYYNNNVYQQPVYYQQPSF
ncbi:MAG: hypothetical protein V3U78_01940 [Thiotrichaceae bacterium]